MNLLNKLKPQAAMDWFNLRDMRERIFLLAVGAVLCYAIVDLTLISASESKAKLLRKKIEVQKTEVARLRKDIAELSTVTGKNTASPQRLQLEGMKRTIAEADAQLDKLGNAPRLGDMVKAVIAASPGLDLVSLKTLPVTVALESKPLPATTANPPADAKAATGAKPVAAKPAAPVKMLPTIYRHGIEVTVKGNYLALLPYLEKLQSYPGRLYWSEVNLDVQTHPDAILKMTIYTMSGQSDPSLG